MTAIARELTYPQLRPFSGCFSRYLSILSLGQTLLLVSYWTMILIMLWSNVVLGPESDIYAYKWEIVGFRAAWVSVTQIPLIYCLGGKANIISLITGISYERLNWLHRWAARTVFLTVIVHWSYFFREWWLSDFVNYELQLMPMVKYGFGAWAVIGWSVITGFGFFRTKCYEVWLLQHLATVSVLLWLLYCHVPDYARYNIWLSIGFVVFDRGVRGVWSLLRNLHPANLWRRGVHNQSVVGYQATVRSHGDNYMSLLIEDVDFEWRPGQHIFVSMPSCGPLESHPFTISNTAKSDADTSRSLQLYFKSHSGFTKRLHERAESGKAEHVRTLVSGPWGNPPLSEIERCNSLIFVASSTGASFTVPLLEHAVSRARFVRRIKFCWIIRHESQLRMFVQRIATALEATRALNLDAEIKIYITRHQHSTDLPQPSISEKQGVTNDDINFDRHQLPPENIVEVISSGDKGKMASQHGKDVITTTRSVGLTSKTTSIGSSASSDISEKRSSDISFCQGRPQNWDELIYPTLIEAEGETVVIACGGRALMADIRNYVGWISDQRAVHKGTGAQGIFLYTETYGW